MRIGVDHLPYGVQEELDHAAHILFEEFAESMAGKQAPHRKAGRILKLILFGAFADPDWCVRDVGEGVDAFDILVVVNHEELADTKRYWRFAADRLDRAWQTAVLCRPVRLTLCSLAGLNRALVEGVPFFVTIAGEGAILYQFSDRPLATPRHLPDAERHARAYRAFCKWIPRGRDFLTGARFFQDADNGPMSALLLHQACEHLYQCVLQTVTLHGRRTHALDELRDLAEQCDVRLRKVWPNSTRLERRVFRSIRRAYVEARYGDHYRIAAEELAWAVDRVEALLNLVVSVCADHLRALQPEARSLEPLAARPNRTLLSPCTKYDLARDMHSGFRRNRLYRDGQNSRQEELPLWPFWCGLAVMALTFFASGYGVRAWEQRHSVQVAGFYGMVEPHRAADPTAVLDFNIRAATVLEAVSDVAERAGYRLQSNDALWQVRWTGAYRSKATTFDALVDILYGTGLCPMIRDDVIMVRECEGNSHRE